MKPKRGSYKEAKSIQHKKLADKFSDFLESQGHKVVDVTPVSSKDWEKGLRKASKGEIPEDTYDDILSYVHSLLNSQRQEIIEEIEGVKKHKHKSEVIATEEKCCGAGICYKYVYLECECGESKELMIKQYD